jgi:hypothetical protein
MSQKHRRTLDAIFTEPVSSNIHWREIESLLNSLGARIQSGHGARFRVALNGIEGTLHRPHHTGSASKQDVRHLREFLLRSGIIGHPANHT